MRIKLVILNIRKQKLHQNSKRKKKTKNDDSVRSLWKNFKGANIHIIGVLEGEERKQEIEILFETVLTENFSKMGEIDIKVQEAQTISNKVNPKGPTPRHIIKLQKVKDKKGILKAARVKQLVTSKRVLLRLSADFSTEILQTRRDSQENLK